MLCQKQITTDGGMARVARLEHGPHRQSSSRPLDFADLQRNLSLRLQTTLELDRLLGFFFEETGFFIGIEGLSYQHAETDFQITLGGPADFELCYALYQDGTSLGQLNLYSNNRLDDSVLEQVQSVIGCLLFPLCNALLYRQAVLASLKDPLTGVGNRLALEQSLSREVELSRRHGQTLSVIMLDMDYFKKLNDTFGHQAGDAALRATALLLREQLRNVDMVFRFGGEEFFLILSNTGAEAAAVVGERIRAPIERLSFLVGEKQVSLSASLGCATFKSNESQDDLLRRADQALYEAKRCGRNNVQVA